jgi:rare lipoprotein A
MNARTAAHPFFAFGTWLRVLNLDNGKSTEVRVNDRGPFVKNRIVDLSRASAREIGMIGPGTARVRLTVIRPPPQNSR